MAADYAEFWNTVNGAKRLLVVTHDNPDPDALAGAAALCHAVTVRTDCHSRICCEGMIGRAENRALLRGLRIKLLEASRVNWKKWPLIALVDTQPKTGNNSLPTRIVPEIVLDHHPLRRRTRARFLDVRPEIGACATIVEDYLQQAAIPIPGTLAAALCYAISSETLDLSRGATDADEAAYMRLYPVADKRFLARILRPRLEHDYFAVLARALAGAFTYGQIIGTHLGEVRHPDSVSLVADLLLQHARMSYSAVTGICNKSLYISLRSSRRQAHVGRLLRAILQPQGTAGGHDVIAGGRIPIADMNPDEIRKLQDDIIARLVHHIRRRKEVELRPLLEGKGSDGKAGQ